MANKNFIVDIVTPTRTVFSGDVQSVSAPGVEGGFQVLHNHAPFLSSIGIGAIKITDAAGKVDFYATSGGFVEVKNNKVIVLAETAEHSAEIDVARAESAKQRAQELLQKKSNNNELIDQERAHAALARALNRLKITHQ